MVSPYFRGHLLFESTCPTPFAQSETLPTRLPYNDKGRTEPGGDSTWFMQMPKQRQFSNSIRKITQRLPSLILKAARAWSLAGRTYTLVSDLPAKHKFATEDLASGANVIMYGGLVGKTTGPIRRGELLTTGNIHHDSTDFHQKSGTYQWIPPDIQRWRDRTFLGYHRADGQVGTRNYWWRALVFCENRNIGVLQQAFEEELGFAAPQIYRREVAELARLYREGKTEEIKTYAQPSNGHTIQSAKLSRTLMALNSWCTKAAAAELAATQLVFAG